MVANDLREQHRSYTPPPYSVFDGISSEGGNWDSGPEAELSAKLASQCFKQGFKALGVSYRKRVIVFHARLSQKSIENHGNNNNEE